MIKRPIFDAMKQFYSQQNHSLHVPGHKHGSLSQLPPVFREVMRFDLTELNGLDDLHHPEEAIKEAEELLAQTYGAEKSFFLINGSTVGNLAMIYAVCRPGDRVIVQRNAHKSIFHGLELAGALPIYVAPEWEEQTKTAGHVSFGTIKEAIHTYPDAKAVILTHPTYYGVVSIELKAISDLCHQATIPLLVDEAHGAHLQASDQFPQSALSMGADLVVQSAHKTLPAMTMGSFLHVNSSLVDIERLNHYLRMLQSSSPSYILMASLDDARAYLSSFTQHDMHTFIQRRGQFVESLKTIRRLEVIEPDDPLKLLLRIPGKTGYQLQAALEQEKVFVELADPCQVLLILPLLKSVHSYPFADIRICIKSAVDHLMLLPVNEIETHHVVNQINISEPVLSFVEINRREKEWIPYMRSIGRIAAGAITPYPPGIPLVVPGEKITMRHLETLEDYIAAGATIQGEHRLKEKHILVVKETSEE